MLRRCALLLITLLLACGSGDATAPSAALTTGSYEVTFTPTGPGASTAPIAATMTFTLVRSDSVAGIWERGATTRTMQLGFFNVDAYVLRVPDPGGASNAYVYRIRPNATCQGAIAHQFSGGQLHAYHATSCSMRRL